MKTATVYYGNSDEPRQPTEAEIQQAGQMLGCTLVQDDTLLDDHMCEPDTTWYAPPHMMYVICRIEGEPKLERAKESNVQVYVEELPWLNEEEED